MVMNIVHCSFHPSVIIIFYFFFVLTGSWHLWWNYSSFTIFTGRLEVGLVILKWTGWICHSFICNRVALVFTGCYCSLWRDMSPHWKWSALILWAHSFLIRWFVSLGNWSQPQSHCLWKFKSATYPFLCERILMNKILSGKTLPNTQWVDSPWLKVRPHKKAAIFSAHKDAEGFWTLCFYQHGFKHWYSSHLYSLS